MNCLFMDQRERINVCQWVFVLLFCSLKYCICVHMYVWLFGSLPTWIFINKQTLAIAQMREFQLASFFQDYDKNKILIKTNDWTLVLRKQTISCIRCTLYIELLLLCTSGRVSTCWPKSLRFISSCQIGFERIPTNITWASQYIWGYFMSKGLGFFIVYS